ncbi:hypothetical protein [Caballeronia sp. GAFFF3]|uniref:hypothetical protein n=1 Tax=Caballeronia sp. GAFFF3 TaxID=2921759 RepID=UPI0020277EAF|nr:hypothetical protein [Caballeronia sp. GAFFF3]
MTEKLKPCPMLGDDACVYGPYGMNEQTVCKFCGFAKGEARTAALSASIADTAGAKPIATLHDDGYYTFHGKKPHDYNYAGWRMDVYAAPPAPSVAETGYAFRCDGRLWVVTDPEVAEKWKAQGFEITPVTAYAPSVADAAGASEDARDAARWRKHIKMMHQVHSATAVRETIAAVDYAIAKDSL